MQISADKPGSVTFEATLMCPHEKREVEKISDNTIALRGQVTRTGRMKVESKLKFEARLAVVSKGGNVNVSKDRLQVTGADSAVLILVAATSYKNYRDISADAGKRCEKIMGDLGDKSFEDIRTDHEDHALHSYVDYQRARISGASPP